MSLDDYKVRRDKFELELESQSQMWGSPCGYCKHIEKAEEQEPCRTCDHNANAVEEEK